MGYPVTDVDFATTLIPDNVVSMLKRCRISAQDRYARYGTIVAYTGGHSYEITTLRSDHAADGRYAQVVFTDQWDQDAQRRDFTMNALYQDAAGTIHDPLGGMVDLKNRFVRFIGNPDDRIIEDHLRILRYMRMAAWYQGADVPLSEDALTACAQNRHRLATLSAERIMAEMIKLLAAPQMPRMLAEMHTSNITAPHLPPFDGGERAARLMGFFDLPVDQAKAALLVLCQDPEVILTTWPLTRSQRRWFQHALTGQDWTSPEALLARALSRETDDTAARALFDQWWNRRTPPITAADLLAAGVPQGPELSKRLTLAQHLWQQDATMTRVGLLGVVAASGEETG
jgi:poly(A) polymerase